MDFFEFGIYVAMIGIAGTIVILLCAIMLKSILPKKPRMAGTVKARHLAGSEAKRISAKASGGKDDNNLIPLKEKSDEKKDKKKDKGKDTNKGKNKDESLPLMEYSEDRLLPHGSGVDKKAKGQKNNKDDKDDMHMTEEPAGNYPASLVGDNPLDSSADQMTKMEEEVEQDLSIGELPTLDTLTDELEEPEPVDLSGDLLSFFETSDVEDSAVGDLANSLFDVDVSNIGELGEEIKQFLAGKR